MTKQVNNCIWGISAFQHDASISVLKDNEIVFAAHSERYSRIKNDSELCQGLVEEAIEYGGMPSQIIYYERSYRTNIRKLLAGRISFAEFVQSRGSVAKKIRAFKPLQNVPIKTVGHHHSHAAAGYFTSGYDEALVVVADAIGEIDTLSVWHGKGNELKRIFVVRYPHSLGLLYSAFTDRLGLRPNEEEFIMMALAAFGQSSYEDVIKKDFIVDTPMPNFKLKRSVYHGIRDWRPELEREQDIAASMQKITEDYIIGMLAYFKERTGLRNLVFSGGIALNCVLNYKILNILDFDDIWIMPNPGDAGNSLGAALAYMKEKIAFKGAFLGHDIKREVDVEAAAEALAQGKIIGIANGRAEFGPRALGNRSLLADPRQKHMKERVNEIKRREPFRPFAPVVLSQYVHDYFDLSIPSPYMQYAANCLKPDELPAICHVDGTSRVQTLDENAGTVLVDVIKAFHKKTGCPVLLNTSLNIKGQPIVNTWDDALEFKKKHDIEVF